jgi:hypothetical protein
MIVFGPFLIPSKHPDFEAEGFTYTGYSMEMVFDDEHIRAGEIRLLNGAPRFNKIVR